MTSSNSQRDIAPRRNQSQIYIQGERVPDDIPQFIKDALAQNEVLRKYESFIRIQNWEFHIVEEESQNVSKSDLDIHILKYTNPLLSTQQAYILQLESELTTLIDQVGNMQEEVYQSQSKLEDELNLLKEKYEKEHHLYMQYKIQRDIEQRSQQFEKEEVQRLIDLYRTSNESLETINKRLMVQVGDLEEQVKEKDLKLKELREDFIQVNNQTYALQEELLVLKQENHKYIQTQEYQQDQLKKLKNENQDQHNKILEQRDEINRVVKQLYQIQSTYEQLQAQKKEEQELLESEVSRYKTIVHSIQMDQVQREQEIDKLREEKKGMSQKLKEMQQDCDQMCQLVEEGEKKENQIEQRERVIEEKEKEFRERKEQFVIEEEKVRLMSEQNEKLKRQLRDQIEEVEQQLEKRVNKILDQERRSHQQEIRQREQELSDLNRILSDTQIENEKIKANEISNKAEIKQLQTIIQNLQDEKKSNFETNIEQIQQERVNFEDQLKESQKEIEQLTLQVSNLTYERSDYYEKYQFYSQKSEHASHELLIMQEDYNRMKEKYMKLSKAKENNDLISNKQIDNLKRKYESLQDESETHVTRHSEREQRRKEERKESELKALDMVLQQERLANKWKYELEQAVTEYEGIIKKLKHKNNQLVNELESYKVIS